MAWQPRLLVFGRAGLLVLAGTLASTQARAQEKGILAIELPVPSAVAEQVRAAHKAGIELRAIAFVLLRFGEHAVYLVDRQEGGIQDLAGASPRFVMAPRAVTGGPLQDTTGSPVDPAGHPVDLSVVVTFRGNPRQDGSQVWTLYGSKINLSEDGYLRFKEMVETKGALLCSPGTFMEGGVLNLVCKPLGISPEDFAAHQVDGTETKGSAGDSKGSP